MKLEGLRRGNRPARAGELLRTPEELEDAWGSADISKAKEFLSNWKANKDAAPNLVACLDILAPGTVTPEQRQELVESQLNLIQVNIQLIDHPEIPGRAFLLGDVGDLLKVDPAARRKIPDLKLIQVELAQHLQNLDTFSETTESPLLVPYTLFAPHGRKISEVAWQKVMDRALASRETWRALELLSMARIISTELFSAHPPPQEVAQRLLHESKKARPSIHNSYAFSQQLFDALILAADQVTVTERDGLQVRLPAQKMTPARPLPERSTV